MEGDTDANLFFLDARTDRIGVGTATPATKLDVAGTIAGTGLAIQGASIFNESGADVDQRMEGDTDANLFFLDASTDRIGVGTATPATKLDVAGTIAGTDRKSTRLNSS